MWSKRPNARTLSDWLHQRGGGSADAADGPSEAHGRSSQRSHGHASAGRLADAGPAGGELVLFLRGRGALHRHRHDAIASQDDKSERPLLLLLLGYARALLVADAAVLFCVTKDHVHVAIERHESAHQCPPGENMTIY